MAVMFALGSLRDEIAADEVDQGDRGLTRKKFLQLGAGAVIAGSVMAVGTVPAYAAEPVRSWVRKNAGNLPATYRQISRLPVDYRRAVFQEVSPALRSSLWVEHLNQYRASHPNLTVEQSRLIDVVMADVRQPASFNDIARPRSRADRLFVQQAQAAFGAAEAEAAFATLGPAEPTAAAQRGCTCSQQSDYCGNDTRCSLANSTGCIQSGGCGTVYRYVCDGFCIN